jgi:hypothetical protein
VPTFVESLFKLGTLLAAMDFSVEGIDPPPDHCGMAVLEAR